MTGPTIISVVNHKGGVGKTTVTANLGAALARRGQRVLLLDLDAQQNLTQSLIGPIPYEEGAATLYDALVDETGLDHLVQSTSQAGMDIIPCSEDFAGADLSLVGVVGRETVLRSCLKKTEALCGYDVVLIDNPPSISLVVVNALTASDYFLVPCSAEYLPMVGLALLSNSVAQITGRVASGLSFLGVVVTLFSRTESICRQIDSQLRQKLGDKVFDTRIRVNTKGKQAPARRMTIFDYEANPKGRGTEDFSRLADEVSNRLASRALARHRPEVANG